MTRWAVTGATGLVGRFIVEDLLARGQGVIVLGRTQPRAGFFSQDVAFRPFHLGDTPDLSDCDALVHCAFDHVPGRYRGGEGDDPEGFRRRNVDGSLALFQRARDQGLARAAFLSTRAVYGDYPDGTVLREDLEPRPDTLYGLAKYEVEQCLAALSGPSFATCSLRATGVYGPSGPGQSHKWAELFAAHLNGALQTPRAGTEVHGADLADALWRAAHQPGATLWNVSDLSVDRRALLAEVNAVTGRDLPLPEADCRPISAMDCTRLAALGWRPRGWEGLCAEIPALLHHVC